MRNEKAREALQRRTGWEGRGTRSELYHAVREAVEVVAGAALVLACMLTGAAIVWSVM